MTKTDRLMQEVKSELERAQIAFPAFHSMHEGYAVLAEEVDELWDLVRAKDSHKMGAEGRRECVQIAAMALRMIIDRGLE